MKFVFVHNVDVTDDVIVLANAQNAMPSWPTVIVRSEATCFEFLDDEAASGLLVQSRPIDDQRSRGEQRKVDHVQHASSSSVWSKTCFGVDNPEAKITT